MDDGIEQSLVDGVLRAVPFVYTRVTGKVGAQVVGEAQEPERFLKLLENRALEFCRQMNSRLASSLKEAHCMAYGFWSDSRTATLEKDPSDATISSSG